MSSIWSLLLRICAPLIIQAARTRSIELSQRHPSSDGYHCYNRRNAVVPVVEWLVGVPMVVPDVVRSRASFCCLSVCFHLFEGFVVWGVSSEPPCESCF